MTPLVYKVERARSLPDAGGRTLYFMIRSGSRRRPHKFFQPGEVPAFDGEVAWFEIDRKSGAWTFLRQVDPRL